MFQITPVVVDYTPRLQPCLPCLQGCLGRLILLALQEPQVFFSTNSPLLPNRFDFVTGTLGGGEKNGAVKSFTGLSRVQTFSRAASPPKYLARILPARSCATARGSITKRLTLPAMSATKSSTCVSARAMPSWMATKSLRTSAAVGQVEYSFPTMEVAVLARI